MRTGNFRNNNLIEKNSINSYIPPFLHRGSLISSIRYWWTEAAFRLWSLILGIISFGENKQTLTINMKIAAQTRSQPKVTWGHCNVKTIMLQSVHIQQLSVTTVSVRWTQNYVWIRGEHRDLVILVVLDWWSLSILALCKTLLKVTLLGLRKYYCGYKNCGEPGT